MKKNPYAKFTFVEALALKPLIERGASAAAIAKSLEKSRIKGVKGDADSCPLANALTRAYPDQPVTVCGTYIKIDGLTVDIEDTPFSVFVNAFDNGRYPSLKRK